MHLVYGQLHETFEQFKACIFKRDYNRCKVCGDEKDLVIHYICDDLPNGGHVSENTITLCPRCKEHADACKLSKAFDHNGFKSDAFFNYIGSNLRMAKKASEKLFILNI